MAILIYDRYQPCIVHTSLVRSRILNTFASNWDLLGIINMVKWTLNKYSGDTTKVYFMGSSSGGMMTNVTAGSYPDIFEAGAAYSGICHACFAGAAAAIPFAPNQTCAQGQISVPSSSTATATF